MLAYWGPFSIVLSCGSLFGFDRHLCCYLPRCSSIGLWTAVLADLAPLLDGIRPCMCPSWHIFQLPMMLYIFGDVLVHISLNPDSHLFHIRALGMPNIALDGWIHIPSLFPQGTFLIVHVDSHLSKNVDIQLWFLTVCVAACLLSS